MDEKLVKDYEDRAKAEREAGALVEINHSCGYVAVERSDGLGYFFQDEEAYNLLDEVPEEINEEDFILAIAQGW